MRFGNHSTIGRLSTRLALIQVDSFRHRYPLSTLYHHGFTAPDAVICKGGIVRGNFVYIGSRVTFFRQKNGGEIIIGNQVYLNDNIRMETGFGGSIEIGDGTHIQPACQFSAYTGNIWVGKKVQIAPRCAFYPYDHGISINKSMMNQPLSSRGGIKVMDEAWIGYGVIVLDGVTIGKGAVVGAGAVVKDDIPDYAVSVGAPAKTIKLRS